MSNASTSRAGCKLNESFTGSLSNSLAVGTQARIIGVIIVGIIIIAPTG
jgi:hypothetical protein